MYVRPFGVVATENLRRDVRNVYRPVRFRTTTIIYKYRVNFFLSSIFITSSFKLVYFICISDATTVKFTIVKCLFVAGDVDRTGGVRKHFENHSSSGEGEEEEV